MNDTELEKRQARAETETLVISHTEGGFRVYNPANITRIYMVSGIPESPACNCPDFDTHKADPDWRCKHILAVVKQVQKQTVTADSETPQATDESEGKSKLSPSSEKKRTKNARNGGQDQMMIKRSISPDGRIDSLSVEFSHSVAGESDQEIKDQAHRSLRIQAEIVGEFLKANGDSRSNGQPYQNSSSGRNPAATGQNNANQLADGQGNGVPAQLVNVGGMNTRRGWQFFINIQVNGTTTKLFGSHEEIRKYITAAGFANIAEHVDNGTTLNLPCRVRTKRSPDGKYLNVEKIFPAKAVGPDDWRGR